MYKFTATILIIIILPIVLLGCSTNNTTTVRLTEVTHSVFYAPQYIAMTQGFFKEEGLEIKLSNGKGADKTMTALLSGQADIGFMGPEASVYVYNQGKKDYAVNFAQLTQKDGSFLVGKEKDGSFTFAKLKGKTIIGGRKGGMPEMTLEYVLKKHNINISDDLTLRCDIQFSMMAGAFTAGEGDYVTLFEPVATTLQMENKGYIVASIGEEAGYIPYTCYCATKSYINENPEIIQSFTNAIYKGMLWTESHTNEEIAEQIADQFPETDKEVLVKLIKRYKDQDTWKPNPILTKEGLNHMMDIIELAGELEKRAPYEKIVTTEFAENAVKNIIVIK
ncbi:ABC transporter substrate-binding protein [Clostridiaceae bacterium M8S5]|nr:ABC transporter substrate-binding protein [Clostridiaceae bacterium M8S5]